ncbi:hypothetical protein ABTB91_19825, partial [Acinetobacter baumannii]
GFINQVAVDRHRALIDEMIDIILAEANRPGPFDFANRDFLAAVRENGATIAADRSAWHIPPVETLFVQRKISGMALLAARLGAHVDLRAK